MKKPAFTLVELIVVITILSILATFGFISYSSYIESSRDASRIAQIKNISDSLQIYSVNESLPIPDEYIEIRASSWLSLWYQWYIWNNVLEAINYLNGWKELEDGKSYVYMISSDRKFSQIGGYLEQAQVKNSKVLANEKVLTNYGSKLGIIIDTESWEPIQEVYNTDSFDLLTSTNNVTIQFSDTEILSASGYTLYALAQTRTFWKAPSDCDIGFIWVPWNAEFGQRWFCVAQYEMTYQDADSPNTTRESGESNTVSYVEWKELVSTSRKYPIWELTQDDAIAACKTLWNGYHLINNNEWMTIARNIESVWVNWSTWIAGEWFIYNWVSWDLTMWCNATGWNIEPRTRWTKTWPWTNQVCNDRRTLQLSNGAEIWDLAWNSWEHVNKDNSWEGSEFRTWRTAVAISPTASGTGAYTNGAYWDIDGVYAPDDMKKYGSAFFYWSTQGMGNIATPAGVDTNTFLRWATAVDGDKTGIYSLDLNRYEAISSYGIGNAFLWFRCTK